MQNASLRLDKQKLKTKVDDLTTTIQNLQLEMETQKFHKSKLNNEVTRLHDLALA